MLGFAENTSITHALSMYGDVKYPPGFDHFQYVNPDAPKGGKVKLGVVGTFDSLNPFILKGVTVSGAGLLFDTLTVQSDDEPFSEYGLLAEKMEVPEDRSWVTFFLRPEARWHDGSPVTSEDVIFSFETLMSKGHPFYRAYYESVEKVEKLGKYKVKFVFGEGTNRELPLIMGQLPVFSKAYYSKHPFAKTSLSPPVGSGPYKVVDVKPGRSITYQRDPNYWGRNLPVNKGRYNFDTISFEYYRDETVAIEAFKAGEYDFRLEHIAKVWATAYQGPEYEKGLLIKEELPNNNPAGMQAFVFNTRRSFFKDRKVRWALAHVFDFEWTNKTLFYGAYTRTESYFANSELASDGLPSEAELELLEPFRGRVPEEVFTREYHPPSTDGSGNIRENLRKALGLLREAGWEPRGGVLVNTSTGQPFRLEILIVQPSMERVIVPFKDNLKRLGIQANIRLVDNSQYINRVDNFDFDMIVHTWRQSLSPGNEQRNFWSSKAADTPGSENLAGIKSPAVDALIGKVISASDRKTLVVACHALDLVLLWGHYVIPHWHITKYRITYWNKFGRPSIKPKYSLGFTDTWWVDPEKAEALQNY
ncbi:MAG: extracellular solute-binding protein [Spirochaetota bacterium]